MKMKLIFQRRSSSGYALLMILGVTGVTLIILAATMSRTTTVARLNERNNQYMANINAAEAAVEKVYAMMAYDFQSYGVGQVQNRLNIYRTNIPNENSYWSNFRFSNGQAVLNRTYVSLLISNFTGRLPSQYDGLIAIQSPIYRIVSNVRSISAGSIPMTNAIQEDVMLALVPITTYAIFYNSLLEFSTCADMKVRGRVHANSNIYVGAGGSAQLTFYSAVTASGTVRAPANAGSSWLTPTVYNPSNWRTTFNEGFSENVSSVNLAINMTNTRSLIEMPAAGIPTNSAEKARMYNQAHMILLVSNTTVTLKIQRSPTESQVPGEATDAADVLITNMTHLLARTNLPFLSLTNKFFDNREDKTNIVTEIDLARYGQWILTNVAVQTKFPKISDRYPTVLYVADNRITNSKSLPSVRVRNAAAIPTNNNLGFSLATPNPLYVWGDYNAPNPASTNTSHVLPSALMSDALTILSDNWSDANSYTTYSTSDSDWDADTTTVNAAILTGVVRSTGTSDTTFSGGVHNLTRMLEDWNGRTLWLNTSIINLYDSAKATNRFVYPGLSGTYYRPPTREFSFDPNFLDPARQPPGVPCALVPIRYNWAVPPANTVTYNVIP